MIQATDLSMVFRRGSSEIRALDGVSLTIPGSQFVVVRGRSGSGKTTLLQVLAGLRRATGGQVRIGDTDLQALPAAEADRFRRRNVGLIFQFFNLLPSLTLEMNVALPLLLENVKLPQLRAEIDELIETLGIGHRRGHAPHELSGGEMQRVAIARALIVRPKAILADEPTGNLDSRAAAEIFALLRDQAARRAVTTVVMTHEPDATAYADRVVTLNDGRIVKDTG